MNKRLILIIVADNYAWGSCELLAELLDADHSRRQMINKCKESVRQEVLIGVTATIRAASA